MTSSPDVPAVPGSAATELALPAELRISDADREAAAAVLHRAVAEGRLSWAEHEERLSGIYAARTGAEVVRWLSDLPASGAPLPVPASTDGGSVVVARLAKIRRRPAPSGGPVQARAVLGAVVLDLRGLPADSRTEVIADSLLGKVEIYVSEGTEVVDQGTATLGKRSLTRGWWGRAGAAARELIGVAAVPDRSVVYVRGHSLFGHVRVTVGGRIWH
jgi:hypothetical protein